MKKRIALFLALCLLFTLAGCGGEKETVTEEAKDQVFKKTGFSISLPASAVDLSTKETAETEPFVFQVDDITIRAQEQYKLDYGYDMTPEEYAKALIKANNYDAAPERKDGIATFTVKNVAENTTSLFITRVTDTSFWAISASCESGAFDGYAETMWQYLSTAKAVANDAVYLSDSYQDVAVEDLTMQLPATAKDVTAQWNNGATFVYSISDENALLAVRESKDSIDEYVESLDYYCQHLIDVNELDCSVQYHNGMPYFTYTTDEGALTHLVTVYEGADAYWYLQSYTETNLFSLLEDSLWAYLETVQVA